MSRVTQVFPVDTITGKDIKLVQEKRLTEIFDPSRSGLLLVDLQNDFLSLDGKEAAIGNDIAPMQAIIPKIQTVTDLFHRLGRPIMRTINYEDPEVRTEAGMDRFVFFEEGDKDNGVFCLRGSKGAELFLPADPGDIVIEKERISSLVNTNLHDVIGKNGIKTLIVAGVKTQRCVARTIQDLSENERSLHVVPLEDCIASDNVERHNAMMAEFREFWPPVITSSELLKRWDENPSSTK